jgi:hypothetical protein
MPVHRCDFLIDSSALTESGLFKKVPCPNDARLGSLCMVCSRYFCVDHESSQEPDYCIECVNVAAGEIRVKENVPGNDGVKGRVYEPIGPYFVSTIASIAKRSDSELDILLATFTNRVRSLEQATDRARIVKGSIIIEKRERFEERSRALKGKSLPTINGDRLKVTRARVKDHEKHIGDLQKSILGGATPQQFLEALRTIQKQKAEAALKGGTVVNRITPTTTDIGSETYSDDEDK